MGDLGAIGFGVIIGVAIAAALEVIISYIYYEWL